jgi:hypothetical protein
MAMHLFPDARRSAGCSGEVTCIGSLSSIVGDAHACPDSGPSIGVPTVQRRNHFITAFDRHCASKAESDLNVDDESAHRQAGGAVADQTSL